MNTTELIGALKIHGSFPTSNDLFSDSDFLSLFNHCLKSEITPMMMKLNEEFFQHFKDFPVVAGSSYRIPQRAIGAMLRDLKLIDASGNYTDLARLYEEDRSKGLSGYYIVRNSIELTPDIASGTLRMKYFIRPSTLVLTTACAQVVGFDSAAGTVEVSSTPQTFSNGILVDFVQNNNPYDLLGIDQTLTGVSGTTLNFTSLPDGLAIGDWVTLATESPVPQVPDEMHPVLIQAALCKTLSSKKDKSYKDELETLMRTKEDAINMLDPRVQNNSNKVRSGKLLGYFARRRY